MKNQKIFSFLLVISILMISSPLISQVYDVFSNKQLKMIGGFHTKTINPVNSVFKQEIEIDYFGIATENTAALKSINNQAYNLCYDYIADTTKAQGLINEIKQRLKVKDELQKSIDRRIGWRNSNISQAPHELKEIRSDIISMVANKLFIEVRFIFMQRSGSRYVRDDKMEITHYYIADLNDGKIMRLKTNFSRSAIEIIENKISKKLNDNYDQTSPKRKLSQLEYLRSNWEYDGDYEEDGEELDSVKIKEEYKDVCVRIDLNEADFYWYGWGLIISFQRYTNSSKIYYGNSFYLFLPLEEAKKILASIPDFSFINKLSQPKTNLRGFNDIELYNSFFNYQRAPSTAALLKINTVSRIPKKVVIKNTTVFENRDNYYSGKTEIEFSSKGQILSETFYQENDQIQQTKFYTYDSRGNMILTVIKNSHGWDYTEINKFDKEFNHIETKRVDGDDFTKTLYFYNGNYIYSFHERNKRDNLSRMQYDSSKFTTSVGGYYLLDNQGNNMAYKSYISSDGVGQYGRDSLGRIVETHFENDRENFYWNYDSLNRISSFQHYGSHRPKVEIQYFYQGNSTLPNKQIKIDFSNRSTYEHIYFWE